MARDCSCTCGVARAKAVKREAKSAGATSGFPKSHASISSIIVCLQNLSQTLPRAIQAHLGSADRAALDSRNRRHVEFVDVARCQQAAVGSTEASQRGLELVLALLHDQCLVWWRRIRRY